MLSSGFVLAIALVLAHAAISMRLYLNHAFIPDEIWFAEHAARLAVDIHGLMDVLGVENAFGYGALYWIVHCAVFSAFDDPWFVLRVVYWAMLVAGNIIFVVLVYRINRERVAIVAAFFITLPMTWWQGKITGPEPLCHFLLLVALLAASSSGALMLRSIAAGFFCGLSIGVKLSSAPMAIFCLAMVVWWEQMGRESEGWRRYAQAALVFGVSVLFGFAMANPFIFGGLGRFLGNAPSAGVSDGGVLGRASDILFGKEWLWEVVPFGSVTEFGVPLFLFFLVVFSAMMRGASKWMVFSYLAAFSALVVMSLFTPGFFGWYLYSLIMLLPLVMAFGQGGSRVLALASVDVMVVVISAYANFGLINEMLVNKRDHIAVLSSESDIQADAAKIYEKFSPGLVVDYSEYNMRALADDYAKAHEFVQIGLDEPRKLGALDFLWNHYNTWVHGADGKVVSCPKIDQFHDVMIVIGDRLARHKAQWDTGLRDWVERSFVSECPGWRLGYYDVRHKMHYFVLQKDGVRI